MSGGADTVREAREQRWSVANGQIVRGDEFVGAVRAAEILNRQANNIRALYKQRRAAQDELAALVARLEQQEKALREIERLANRMRSDTRAVLEGQ